MGLERRLDGVQYRAGCAVAGVDHQLQRLERGGIDVGQQVLDVGRAVGHLAALARLRRRGGECGLLGHQADVLQAGVAADRLRALAHQLEAVVVDRVVRGGHLDAAVGAQVPGGEIHFLGAGHAQVQHGHAGFLQAAGQGGLERRRGLAHVAAEYHGLRLQPFGVGSGDAVGDVFVQLAAQLAADVIGFEAGEGGHQSFTGGVRPHWVERLGIEEVAGARRRRRQQGDAVGLSPGIGRAGGVVNFPASSDGRAVYPRQRCGPARLASASRTVA